MKTFLFLILFTVFAFGQIVNETFSNFSFPTDDSTHLHLRLKDTNAHVDLTANNYDMTPTNFSANYADELTAGNPIISGANVLQFTTAQTEYFIISNASSPKLEPRTSDFTIDVMIKFTGTVGASYNVFVSSGNTSGEQGYEFWLTTAGGALNFRVNYGSAKIITVATDYKDSQWHKLTGVREGDSLKFYIDNVLKGSATGLTGQDINQVADFNVGRRRDNAYYTTAQIAVYRFTRRAFTPKERNEAGFLAANWYSKNGGVTRDAWAFNQGIIADTVYHAISTPGAAIGRVDAWGASGGETLTVFNKAGDSQSFELTADSTRKTITSITFAASDSVYFSASAGDTVYIDNVYLEAAPAASATNTYANQFSGFPEYQDFINYEVIDQ